MHESTGKKPCRAKKIRNYQKSDLCAEDKAAPLHVVII